MDLKTMGRDRDFDVKKKNRNIFLFCNIDFTTYQYLLKNRKYTNFTITNVQYTTFDIQ